jgi:hypothetical protein
MTSTDPFTVTIIADYGPLSDMAFAEVTKNIYKQMEGLPLRVNEYSVPAFDTVQTGFMLAQTAINSQLGKKHLFFVNTAPRHDDAAPRADAAGEKLTYMELQNGVRIVAVNSGHSLSFVKDAAVKTCVVSVETEGCQFRSRDFYPRILGQVARGDESSLTAKTPQIAEVPDSVIGFVDGYGNLKCTIDPDLLEDKKGKFVTLSIDGVKHFARIGGSIFDVPDGYLCMARGSSGWTLPDGSKRRFAEIVRRSGSAWKDFEKPRGGAKVVWAAVES